ncbi:MAG TPA: FAD-dependent oxidoreductase, partial [Solirubrobacteraceae bacterium]
QHFFKTYTEKLWGVSATEIRAEWAAQRIKGLSFFSAAKAAFFGNEGNKIKSLISEFNYPRFGPGQMWEQMTADITAQGGEVRLNAPVTRLRVSGGRVTEVVAGGETLYPSHVISSLPLRTTVGITEPEAPLEVRDAARGLRYREFLTVLLVIDVDDPFDDNWIYIHQPGVRVLRIQNFKSWSPWMVPEGETASSIGMEYFCFEGDELWNMADDDLVAMAGQEIEKLHLARADKVRFGFVERVHKAYPIYDELYGERVKTIRGWLETVSNLTQVGRNGLHRYNNSDHSMLTAMRAVDNILEGTHHDIWAVNAESVYHEEHQENEDPYRRPPTTPAMEQPLASER